MTVIDCFILVGQNFPTITCGALSVPAYRSQPVIEPADTLLRARWNTLFLPGLLRGPGKSPRRQ